MLVHDSCFAHLRWCDVMWCDVCWQEARDLLGDFGQVCWWSCCCTGTARPSPALLSHCITLILLPWIFSSYPLETRSLFCCWFSVFMFAWWLCPRPSAGRHVRDGDGCEQDQTFHHTVHASGGTSCSDRSETLHEPRLQDTSPRDWTGAASINRWTTDRKQRPQVESPQTTWGGRWAPRTMRSSPADW